MRLQQVSGLQKPGIWSKTRAQTPIRTSDSHPRVFVLEGLASFEDSWFFKTVEVLKVPDTYCIHAQHAVSPTHILTLTHPPTPTPTHTRTHAHPHARTRTHAHTVLMLANQGMSVVVGFPLTILYLAGKGLSPAPSAFCDASHC